MILARLIRVCASALLCAGVSLFPGNASADGAGTVVDGRAILKMSKGSNLCALTFDDGPSSHTERLMEILRERGIHATFFVVGKQVKYHPELIVRLQQEGHEIGNHTYSHKSLRHLSVDAQRSEILSVQELLRKLGVHSRYIRPPYGNFDANTVAIAKAEGADAICHGCTGKGNDQVRFELAIKRFAPEMKIIAPWREWDIKGRDEEIDYAEAHNVPLKISRETNYSKDKNLWHLSHEGLDLEDPANEPDYDKILEMGVSPEKAPDKATYITLSFEKGIPVALDGEKLDVVLMQLVRLMRDGEIVRMSKRTGKAIQLADLLDEVPVDAARFLFNMREANSLLDFDLDLAVQQDSQNPVYYVQYAHARICSILRALEAEGVTPRDCTAEELALLTAPEELELIQHIASYTDEIIGAAKDYDPVRITRYVIELATKFHKFYNACRVKGEEESLMQARLTLCRATATVIRNVLTMFNITVPTSM